MEFTALKLIEAGKIKKTILGGLLVLFSASIISCSSTPEPPPSDPLSDLSGTDEQIFVGDTLEMNYDPNVIMKRAESYYEKESYPEAIVEYKHFLDLHRSHVLAPYAQYKIASSHYKRFKSVDRDPEPIGESLAAFEKLLSEFPNSRYEEEARARIKDCHQHLAEHHLLVGDFYYKKESYLAAAHRYETVIKSYPELDVSGEALYHLAQTYENLGAEQWAANSLVDLVLKHPNHKFYGDGMKMLAKMQADDPTLQVADLNVKQPGLEILHAGYENGAQTNALSAVPFALAQLSASSASALPSQNVSYSPATGQAMTDPGACSLGSWCESSAVSFAPPPLIPPKICQVSQWC